MFWPPKFSLNTDPADPEWTCAPFVPETIEGEPCGEGELRGRDGCHPRDAFDFVYSDWTGSSLSVLLGSLEGADTPVLFDLNAGTGAAEMVSLSPDGRRIAYIDATEQPTCSAQVLITRDLANGTVRRHLALDGWSVATKVSFSPDGNYLVFSYDGLDEHTRLRILDIDAGTIDSVLTDPAAAPNASVPPSFSPDGGTVLYGSGDNRLMLFDLAERSSRLLLHTAGPVQAAFWGPNGDVVYYVVWDLAGDQHSLMAISLDGDALPRWLGTPADMEALPTVSPDGRLVAYVGYDYTIHGHVDVVDVESASVIASWWLGGVGIGSGHPAFAPDSKSLLFTSLKLPVGRFARGIIRRFLLEDPSFTDVIELNGGPFSGYPIWLPETRHECDRSSPRRSR